MSDYRKLRTIYDALDAHNFKQSLKLCDAALKKAADTSMVKALKAVTLERMGRTEEGLKLARDVASEIFFRPRRRSRGWVGRPRSASRRLAVPRPRHIVLAPRFRAIRVSPERWSRTRRGPTRR